MTPESRLRLPDVQLSNIRETASYLNIIRKLKMISQTRRPIAKSMIK